MLSPPRVHHHRCRKTRSQLSGRLNISSVRPVMNTRARATPVMAIPAPNLLHMNIERCMSRAHERTSRVFIRASRGTQNTTTRTRKHTHTRCVHHVRAQEHVVLTRQREQARVVHSIRSTTTECVRCWCALISASRFGDFTSRLCAATHSHIQSILAHTHSDEMTRSTIMPLFKYTS